MRIGDQVGSFRLVRLLAQGGMGAVYEAHNDNLNRRVAVKILHASLAADNEISARFHNEARVVNLVSHPSLVTIHEYGTLPSGSAYIVMEYLDGQTLAQRLRARGSDPLPVSQTVRIARQVAAALAAAHDKDVVHRDLKPENLMLVADPEVPGGERVKILDFGIAKVKKTSTSEPGRTLAGIGMGTPGYIAPEQIYGASSVDGRADVYSLGIILYEMLCGHRPFRAKSGEQEMQSHLMRVPPPLLERMPSTPPALAGLAHAMLAKQPEQRPTMRECVEHLHAVEFSTPGSLAPAATQRPLTSRRFASSVAFGAVIATLLLLAINSFRSPAPIHLQPAVLQIPAPPDLGTAARVPPVVTPQIPPPAPIVTPVATPVAPSDLKPRPSSPVTAKPLLPPTKPPAKPPAKGKLLDENEILQLK